MKELQWTHKDSILLKFMMGLTQSLNNTVARELAQTLDHEIRIITTSKPTSRSNFR